MLASLDERHVPESSTSAGKEAELLTLQAPTGVHRAGSGPVASVLVDMVG